MEKIEEEKLKRDVIPGASLLLMQEIAEQLYASTPGLTNEMPIKESKILGPQFATKNGQLISKENQKIEPQKGEMLYKK